MMWLVRLALRRPLSVAVMALLMLVLGVLSFSLMNIDIFPAINLPVVMVVWNYPGLSAVDIEQRMVFITERAGVDYCQRHRAYRIRVNQLTRYL
jgi:multidrug efflux pump subunit AcrB